MNKILSLAGAIALAASCTAGFEEINTNPNQMSFGDINPTGLLQELVYSTTEVFLYRTWQLNGELIQYTVSGTSNNSYHRYDITNATMSSNWTNMYKWASQAEHMRSLAVDKEDKACEAIALTMKCLLVQNLTDIYGDIPYSEAFKGASEGLTKPRFDTQQSVYESLIADLERANSLYAENPSFIDTNRDFLYAGDLSKWRKFNNSLYLRVLMRLSNRDNVFKVSEKIAYVYNNPSAYPVFADNGDNATLYYNEVEPFVNYFGNSLESAFSGRRPAEQIINMMAPVGDPRTSIWFRQASGADSWKGAESGKEAQDSDKTDVSYLNKSNLGDFSSPYSNMKYDEVLFIWAEAAKRGWIPGGDEAAASYYEKAIRASLAYWTSVSTNGASYNEIIVSRFLEKIPYDGTLEQILSQKYIALFWVGYEGWHEYRRTGMPKLTIGAGTLNDHILPTRLVYPIESVAQINPDNYAAQVERMRVVYGGADDMKTPVWWSKDAVGRGIK